MLGALFSLIGGARRDAATRQMNTENIEFQRETNETNWARQKEVNADNRAHQTKINSDNIAFQREINAQSQRNFETQRSDSKRTLQDMRADAEAAGFNPLTAMRGGAAQAYNTSQAPALMSPQAEAIVSQASYDLSPSVDPEVGMAETLINLGGTMYSAFANQPDPEKEALEKSLLMAELGRIQQSNEALFRSNFGYDIPSITNTSGVEHGPVDVGGYVGLDGRLDSASDFGADTSLNPIGEAPAATAFGVDLEPSGRFSSGQQFEDAFSELAAWPLGAAGFLDTVGNTFGRRIAARRERKFWEELYAENHPERMPKRRFGRGTSMPFLAASGLPDQWFYN